VGKGKPIEWYQKKMNFFSLPSFWKKMGKGGIKEEQKT